jgi:hypothetical protein
VVEGTVEVEYATCTDEDDPASCTYGCFRKDNRFNACMIGTGRVVVCVEPVTCLDPEDRPRLKPVASPGGAASWCPGGDLRLPLKNRCGGKNVDNARPPRTPKPPKTPTAAVP